MINEPTVKIGVLTDGEPVLSLRGEFERIESKYSVRYVPTGENSRVIVKNSLIGKDFHWQRSKEIELKGEVTLLSGGSECRLTNKVGIEDYLCSVISSEMNHDAPSEFLKAHAIISRSWIMGKLERFHPDSSEGKKHTGGEIITWADTADHHEFDVCSDDHCQRYQGDADVNANVMRAVEMTRGIVLTDTLGCIIDARFSKCCGGRTELFSSAWQDIGFSYLQPVDDPYCNLGSLSDEERKIILTSILKEYDKEDPDIFEWGETVPKTLVAENMRNRFHTDLGEVSEIKPMTRGASGRIYRLLVKGDRGSIIVGKELAIRRLLSPSHLKSSAFDITDQGDSFLLKGRGWGHGVGLCQTGAAVMALKGKSFSEILAYYYPSTHLSRQYD